jgi:hypothetical protein
MEDFMRRWMEFNAAMYLFGQEQWEKYFLSLGEDRDFLKDRNREVFQDVTETLKKYIDQDRVRFLNSMSDRFDKNLQDPEAISPGRIFDGMNIAVSGIMKHLHRTSVTTSKLESDIYDAILGLWSEITKHIRTQKTAAEIDRNLINDILVRFKSTVEKALLSDRNDFERAKTNVS